MGNGMMLWRQTAAGGKRGQPGKDGSVPHGQGVLVMSEPLDLPCGASGQWLMAAGALRGQRQVGLTPVTLAGRAKSPVRQQKQVFEREALVCDRRLQIRQGHRRAPGHQCGVWLGRRGARLHARGRHPGSRSGYATDRSPAGAVPNRSIFHGIGHCVGHDTP